MPNALAAADPRGLRLSGLIGWIFVAVHASAMNGGRHGSWARWMGFRGSLMADVPYLVALAFLEIGGKRALPLSGRSLPAAAGEASDPGDEGRTLALELMLRLWQRSDEGPIQRAAGDNSLLLVELPLDLLSEQLPLLKASWIAGGDTSDVLRRLERLVRRGWRMVFTKYEPVSYQSWPGSSPSGE